MNPSSPKQIAFVIILSILSIGYAQEALVQSPPPVGSQAVTTPEALTLAGFPLFVLKYEPAIAVAFQLTPEQADYLKKASEETIGQAKQDMADNPDPAQVRKITQRALKEFNSRRDSILTTEQISMITVMSSSHSAASKQRREEKKGDLKTLFLANLKIALSAEEVERIIAAGGKLP